MSKLIVTAAVVLIALGVVGYLASGMASVTALIPSFFGVVIGVCGLVATKRPTVGAIAAGVFALVGLGGTLSRLIPMFTTQGGFQFDLAVGAQIVMALVCAVLVVLIIAWSLTKRAPAGPPN